MCSGGGPAPVKQAGTVSAPPPAEPLAPTSGGLEARPGGPGTDELNNGSQQPTQMRREDFNQSSIATQSGSGLRM